MSDPFETSSMVPLISGYRSTIPPLDWKFEIHSVNSATEIGEASEFARATLEHDLSRILLLLPLDSTRKVKLPSILGILFHLFASWSRFQPDKDARSASDPFSHVLRNRNLTQTNTRRAWSVVHSAVHRNTRVQTRYLVMGSARNSYNAHANLFLSSRPTRHTEAGNWWKHCI